MREAAIIDQKVSAEPSFHLMLPQAGNMKMTPVAFLPGVKLLKHRVSARKKVAILGLADPDVFNPEKSDTKHT